MLTNGVNLVNRTNNPLERYNREFGEMFLTANPSLLVFVEMAKRSAIQYATRIADIRLNHQRPPTHAQGVEVTLPEAYVMFE
jgi:hypothetical protein